MKFSELLCCPFCGGEPFYTMDFMYGSNAYRQRFDGGEPENNEGMYDGLKVVEGKRAYCDTCGKYIGNIYNNSIGECATKFLKGGGT